MKRVLIAAALGGLLIVGAPTLASSAERKDTKAEKRVADKRDDKADSKGGDHKGGDRADHKGDRGDSDHRGDRNHRGDRRYGHGYYRDGYYGGGYYYGEPYDCWYGPSGAYNCEPYGGDYYGGYDGGRYRSRGGSGNVTVSQKRFNPPEVFAHRGQEVLWVFRDGAEAHTVTADNNSFDSGKVTEGEFRLVFDQPGSYSYHCAIHPEMKGRVIVQG
jgi:plastocyanin